MERVSVVFEDGKLVEQKKEVFLPYAELSKESKARAYDLWRKTAYTDGYVADVIDHNIVPAVAHDEASKNGLKISDDIDWDYDDKRGGAEASVYILEINTDYVLRRLPISMRSRAEFLFGGGYEIVEGRPVIIFADPHGVLNLPSFVEVADAINNVAERMYWDVVNSIERAIDEEYVEFYAEDAFYDNIPDGTLFNVETGEPHIF